MLIYAAQRNDLSLFEYLVEHGATIPSPINNGSDDTRMVASMLQHRQDWIDQAAAIVRRWRLPMIAVRVMHEYVVGFNWSVVSDMISKHV